MADERRPLSPPRTRDETYAAAYRELWDACDAVRASPRSVVDAAELARSVVTYARRASTAGVTRGIVLLQLRAALDTLSVGAFTAPAAQPSDLIRQAMDAYRSVNDGARSVRDIAAHPPRTGQG